jgi:cytochrome c oxidase subunit 4
MSMLRERAAEAHTVEHEVHAHPGPRRYVQIGVILAVCTAIEVGLSYLDIVDWLKIVGMLIVMAIKFSLVVMWFMHLRFDNRLFSVMFTGGLALAMTVFVVVLTIQRVFFA